MPLKNPNKTETRHVRHKRTLLCQEFSRTTPRNRTRPGPVGGLATASLGTYFNSRNPALRDMYSWFLYHQRNHYLKAVMQLISRARQVIHPPRATLVGNPISATGTKGYVHSSFVLSL